MKRLFIGMIWVLMVSGIGLPSAEARANLISVLGTGQVEFIQPSPDGRYLLVATTHESWVYTTAQLESPLMTITGHPERVRTAAFYGDLLATGGYGGYVVISDLAQATTRHRVLIDSPIAALNFSGDGNLLSVRTGTQSPDSIYIVNAETGASNLLTDPFFSAFTLLDDHARVVTAGEIKRVGADLEAQMMATINAPDAQPQAVMSQSGISSDGRYLFTATDDGLRLATGEGQMIAQLSPIAGQAQFSPRGKYLIVPTENDQRVYDTATGTLILTTTSRWDAAQFSPDDRFMLYRTATALHLRDHQTGRDTVLIESLSDDMWIRAAWGEQTFVLSPLSQGVTSLWHSTDAQMIRDDIGNQATFNPDGSLLMILQDGRHRIVDGISGDDVLLLPDDYSRYVWGAAGRSVYGRSGNRLARIALADGAVSPVGLPVAHDREITALAFVGSTLVSGDASGQLLLWDATTGAYQRTLQVGSRISGLYALDDTRLLVTASGNIAQIIDLAAPTADPTNLMLDIGLDLAVLGNRIVTLDREAVNQYEFDGQSAQRIGQLPLPGGFIAQVDASSRPDTAWVLLPPDGGVVIADETAVYVWADSEGRWWRHVVPPEFPIVDLTATPQGIFIASDAMIQLTNYNTPTPSFAYLYSGSYEPLGGVAYGAGHLVTVETSDYFSRRVSIWNPLSGLQQFSASRPFFASSGFSLDLSFVPITITPEATRYAALETDNTISLWTMPSGLTRDPITISDNIAIAYCDQINAQPDVLSSAQPLTILYSWYAQEPQQVIDHMQNALYDVRIAGYDAQPFRTWHGSIRRDAVNNDDWTVYYYEQYAPLPAGTYTIQYDLRWDWRISDGYDEFGPDTANESNTGTCQIRVE